VGLALVKIAALYLVLSLAVGLAMAMRGDFSLVSVHSHLGLLGWAAMGLTGVIYLAVPRTGGTRLAVAHFWLHNVGLPVMMVALAVLYGLDEPRAEPVVGVGSVIVIAGLVAFTVNLFLNGGSREAETAGDSTRE